MAKTILVVDDSPSVRQLSSLALTRAGYEVVEAADGMDALAKLSGTRVSLIVCDVNMPKMNGLELSKQVKQMKDHRFTPIVICTTEGGQSLIDQGKALGVKAWLVKPFRPDALLDVVTKLAPL